MTSNNVFADLDKFERILKDMDKAQLREIQNLNSLMSI